MKKEAPKHFKARILLLSTMLTLAGIAFIGIGMFQLHAASDFCTTYSPAVFPA